MIDISLSSNGQTRQQLPLVSIYWDFQNTKLSLDEVQLLIEFANSKGRLICKNMYYNSQCADQAYAKNGIANVGFKCSDVPCPLKNSADNQLMVDCLEELDSNQPPDIFILVSGDGDFVKLVRSLQKLGKKIIVFAQRGNVKQRLKELADEFYFVDELHQLFENKIQLLNTANEAKINYNEAIECLIAAIKIALNQRNQTGFSYIDNLMRKHNSAYQGFSSIITSDGKKFKSFGKFIASAVKEGKVKMQNQQLFLIEFDKLAA